MNNSPKNIETGKKKEKDVVKWLEKHRWEIKYSGGRGPADIIARSGGRYWFIQVKYTRSTEMWSEKFNKEKVPLIKLAEKNGGTAVLCYVIQNSIWFVSAKTDKDLMRGRL